jgi:glycerol uptake facilitator-like aquaporin
MDKYLVEFFGTMLIVFVYLVSGDALATGAATAVAILVGSKLSGANFNPVITLVMGASGKQSTNETFPYIMSQFLGGLVALELSKRIALK